MSQPLADPTVDESVTDVEGDPNEGKKPAKAADGLNADLAKERARNKQLAEQLTKLQRANMDELERTKAELKDMDSEIKTVSLERDKLRLALELKMPWSLAKRITGDTLDEMREDAKELMSTIKPEDDNKDNGTGKKKPVNPPTNDNHAGKGGSGGTTDFDAMLREARKAR